MSKVSRPMQFLLAAVLLFAVVWFAVLRPKDEPVAATPVTPAETTPAADAGGAAAKSALGKTIETAKTGAADADAAVKARENTTGEETTASTPAATPSATVAPKATTPAATTPAAEKAEKAAAKGTDEDTDKSASQKRADKVIKKIASDLSKRRAVVVLVWSKKGKEDKIVHRRLQKNIDRRNGRVRVYFVNVSDVGRYDGLLGGLSLGQIPSTVVIAPNNQAKVLGGLVSTARVDRLTSSATLIKPVDTAKKK